MRLEASYSTRKVKAVLRESVRVRNTIFHESQALFEVGDETMVP